MSERLARNIYPIAGALFLAVAILTVLREPTAEYDFSFPLCGARALLAGVDPYGACPIVVKGITFPQNPLTTILAALPFLPFGPFAPAVMMVGFSLLLAYGILRTGQPWRLLIFSSAVYWQAVLCRQWAPLLVAVYLLPGLLPLVLVKPQVGLPVFLLRLTRRRLAAVVAFGFLSLAIDPAWPLRFWRAAGAHYSGFIPLLVLPLGPLLLLALLRWREEKARLLLAVAAMPQHYFYDPLLLWLLPATPRQMIALSISSWVGYLSYPLTVGDAASPLADWSLPSVIGLYLPALLMLLSPEARALANNARRALGAVPTTLD